MAARPAFLLDVVVFILKRSSDQRDFIVTKESELESQLDLESELTLELELELGSRMVTGILAAVAPTNSGAH